jgi:signal peptidase II
MIFWISACVFILDRITKSLVINNIFLGQSTTVVPHVLNFTLVLNTGTAFGLFKGQKLIFILFSVLVISAIIFYARKRPEAIDKARMWSLGLILGGAAGNLLDRVRHGCVIDFLDFHIWPVFNVADSCITIGVIILLINMWTRAPKREA